VLSARARMMWAVEGRTWPAASTGMMAREGEKTERSAKSAEGIDVVAGGACELFDFVYAILIRQKRPTDGCALGTLEPYPIQGHGRARYEGRQEAVVDYRQCCRVRISQVLNLSLLWFQCYVGSKVRRSGLFTVGGGDVEWGDSESMVASQARDANTNALKRE